MAIAVAVRLIHAALDYAPIATGPLGSITTRDGDNGFDAPITVSD